MTGIFTILALLYIGLGQILPTDNINSEVI